MKELVSGLLSSKKFFVFILSSVTMVLTRYTNLAPEDAAKLADEIMFLAMAYLGGQGIADGGKALADARKPQE